MHAKNRILAVCGVVNAVELDAKHNATNRPEKSKHISDELKDEIFGVDESDNAAKCHHQKGVAYIHALLARRHIGVFLKDKVCHKDEC